MKYLFILILIFVSAFGFSQSIEGPKWIDKTTFALEYAKIQKVVGTKLESEKFKTSYVGVMQGQYSLNPTLRIDIPDEFFINGKVTEITYKEKDDAKSLTYQFTQDKSIVNISFVWGAYDSRPEKALIVFTENYTKKPMVTKSFVLTQLK